MILRDVGKRYGDRVALEHITLEFPEGAITAVLGESGAGKTTLLNVLAGQTSFTGEAEGAKPCSYLFQSPKLLPNLTAEQNLRFVLPKEKWGEVRAMLCRVGLAGREGVLLARSLAQKDAHGTCGGVVGGDASDRRFRHARLA